MVPVELDRTDADATFMQRALDLAALGRGLVEPNPMVGCVVVRDGKTVGEGWHRQFGGPHAEIDALRAAGESASGATLYVSLEPCCHHGKTPPCTDAIIAAGICRVVVALADPFPEVKGRGLRRLQQAGLDVRRGVLESQARQLNAPYLKLLRTGHPWIIAKWAMTLDGKLATTNSESRWISGAKSREIVHRLRGRVDAILVGRGTVTADNPLLTARPRGSRVATRIVLDSSASLRSDSQLVRTITKAPVLVACSTKAPPESCECLRQVGCEVLKLPGTTYGARLNRLFDELGRRRMTNVLVEGGGEVLGQLIDRQWVDEVHVFVAPKLAGGAEAMTIGGRGVSSMNECLTLDPCFVETVDTDAYVWGQTARQSPGRKGRK